MKNQCYQHPNHYFPLMAAARAVFFFPLMIAATGMCYFPLMTAARGVLSNHESDEFHCKRTNPKLNNEFPIC